MTKREQQILQWIAEDPMISQEALAARAGIARSSVAVHISNLMKKGYIAGKGYVLRQADYAVVIGGVNMDIGGQSFGPLVARDSNPGAVRVSPGGVGRNIAHNMALLGLDVRMLTALGDDLYARQIAAGSTGLKPGAAVLRLPHLHLPVLGRAGRGHGPGGFGHGPVRANHPGIPLRAAGPH